MNPKLKVLIAADTFYPKVDGTLRFMEEFIKRTKNIFELSLLVPDFDHKKTIKGIKTTFLETSKIFQLSTYHAVKFSFKNTKKIKKAVKEADLVFVQGPAVASFLSIHYAKKYHKKIVFYTHMFSWKLFEKNTPLVISWLFSGLVKKIVIRFLNKCDLVLLPYKEIRGGLRHLGIKTNMDVAKLGIDIDRFYPSKNKNTSKKKMKLPPKIIVGYVGRISSEKNTIVLLKAFKKLDPQKYHLLMVGDGRPEIVKKFKEVKNCTVTGFVDNVEAYLRAMDIFVMPSLTETTSLATLEAMSCGIPVIVTKVGFMKEYVVKDRNGIFFPRASPTLLALKIDKLANDSKTMDKFSRNARKTVAYSFSWERSINKMKRIFLNLSHTQKSR
ncbi:glycosyltransferase family 4 protein [Candidatus Woesearchaeota archaeon]|nr:glycosyltransferase family 4 protein [Candidatus Woesearchaeota archaeon]